jgi:hypothetical protein
MTATAFVGFGVVLAIVVVAAVVIAMAVIGRKRHVPHPDPAYTDDPTGYVPGVWLLGGAESAAPGDHAHAHAHHGADAGGAHAADAGGAGDAGGSGDAGGDGGAGGH